jgi:UMF1 family MFS transporter
MMGGAGLLARSMGYSSDIASRISIASISIFFIIGGGLFYFVDEEKGREEVKYLERNS